MKILKSLNFKPMWFISFFYPIQRLCKTPFWTMLILARKAFIIFNAIIGVWAVLKITNMNHETFLANFVAMGTTYVDLFKNFVIGLFNGFFDLFDMKIVPNVPNKPNNSGDWWPWTRAQTGHTKPMVNNGIMPSEAFIKDFYKTPYQINVTPWYKDITTWLWIGAGLLGAASIVGGICVWYYMSNNTPKMDRDPLPPAQPLGQAQPAGYVPPLQPQVAAEDYYLHQHGENLTL